MKLINNIYFFLWIELFKNFIRYAFIFFSLH